ncbi:hypothetical protein I7I50_06597 [Histoplasma capsulatum G186AR]|uniref:Uncharacterized protein n=1 Tax=Ajellomyces capsulatus TaxID=5037 RepID=A0A8H7YWP6_AJECA|nr:hypothetical protein I7I52_10331 [Histoplasma capsulatum]QSS67497.1 hypothetical protein I7I50_06597 [Histoplasma capsulatum G186AR]
MHACIRLECDCRSLPLLTFFYFTHLPACDKTAPNRHLNTTYLVTDHILFLLVNLFKQLFSI